MPAEADPWGSAKSYGSFVHFEEIPDALFLTGEINDGDYFQLRKAMREDEISIIVAASPGGSVFEALQIAGVIHDTGMSTYVPKQHDFLCASACAFVFFAGGKRLVGGELGVHQFYGAEGSALDKAGGAVASIVTQYTTGEIIAFLNDFKTPPEVYAKMFSTTDMYWFDATEKAELALGEDDPLFVAQTVLIDSLVDVLVATMPKKQPPQLLATEDPVSAKPNPEPAAPPTAAPEEKGFKITYDADLFGNDIMAKGVRDVSLSRCQELCAESTACAAYTYIPETRWCWPKFAVGSMSFKSDAVTGIKYGEGALPALPVDTGFLEYTSKDIAGFDLLPGGLPSTSLQDCRLYCTARSDCAAFTWVRDKQWCWPKSFVGPASDRLGMITGVKP